jgi:PAS domain S-box-containing protein
MPHDQDESRLRTVLDTAVDGIILMDAEGRIIMFNRACETLFGYRADEVIGRNVKMLMPLPYREEHDHYLQSYFRTGEKKIIGIGREVTGQRKDGSTFPMDVSVGEARRTGSRSSSAPSTISPSANGPSRRSARRPSASRPWWTPRSTASS